MIIDSHYHLDERLLSTTDLLRKMDEAGINRVALIACMNDPLPELHPMLAPIVRFLLVNRSFRSLGKKLAANFTKDGNLRPPKGEVIIYTDPDNETVFKTAERHPDRFNAWVFVNPHGQQDPVTELKKYIKHPAFVGVKSHPFWHQYQPIELAPVAIELAKTGKPLLMHAGFDENGNFEALLQKVPNLKIILAHTAFPEYADSWKIIKNNPNIYVDLSQTVYVNAALTTKAVKYLGIERCIFGTDGPYGPFDEDGLFDMGYLKRRIENLYPEYHVRELLLGKNFADICGIK